MSSQAAGAKAAFEFIYRKVDQGSTDIPKALSLDHFETLASAVGLDLSNLSMYVLAYYLNAADNRTYTITEQRFVTGMSAIWPSKGKCNESNDFEPAFKALSAAVKKTNTAIIANKEEFAKFYRFLYQWCLKPLNDNASGSNEENERRKMSVELWSLFFHDGATQANPEQQFIHYHRFPRLGDWIDFVQSNEFSDHITLDLWQELVPFAKLMSYESYNPEDAWPVALDNFVEWQKKREAAA